MAARKQPASGAPAVRLGYEAEGVAGYYEQHGATYRNPHEPAVRRALRECLTWGLDLSAVLDLGCGSGEMSLELLAAGVTNLTACDPYTGAAYTARVSRPCEPWSFLDLARGGAGQRQFSLIVASYVLHLCPESLLPLLAWELAQRSSHLLILSPNKRPILEPAWGWVLERADYRERVRIRRYRALSASTADTETP